MSRPHSLYIILIMYALLALACEGEQGHSAPAIDDNDSLPFMHATGVSTLISDSGVVRYKLVAEEWDIYNQQQPPTWSFMKGAFIQRFDHQMHVDLYGQADTVYYRQQHLWEMRGRVSIRNAEGLVVRTEELFYDEQEHRMWSNVFTRLTTPDRDIEGDTFRAKDDMTEYYITNSKGSFPMNKDKEEESQNAQ